MLRRMQQSVVGLSADAERTPHRSLMAGGWRTIARDVFGSAFAGGPRSGDRAAVEESGSARRIRGCRGDRTPGPRWIRDGPEREPFRLLGSDRKAAHIAELRREPCMRRNLALYLANRMWRLHPGVRSDDQLTPGERAADRLRNGMGSWAFVFVDGPSGHRSR